MTDKLNVSRAADREQMAMAILELMKLETGWTAAVELMGNREVWVSLKGPRGLSLTIDLDGDSRQQRQGTFVLSWHGVRKPHKLARSFAPSVNEYHWHKATDICEGFDDVLATLQTRMASAVDGSAFQSEGAKI